MNDSDSNEDVTPVDPQDASSEALVGMIVTFRALGICKDEARSAMAELLRRQEDGDDFDYESMIQEKLDSLPKPNLSPDALKVMSSIAQFGNK